MTTIALEAFYKGYMDYLEGKREESPEYYWVNFPDIGYKFKLGNTGPLRELLADRKYTTAQFIGSAIYHFNFNKATNILNIRVEDTKNARSLFLHLTEDKHTREEKKKFGETKQTYYFSVTLEEIEKRINSRKKTEYEKRTSTKGFSIHK